MTLEEELRKAQERLARAQHAYVAARAKVAELRAEIRNTPETPESFESDVIELIEFDSTHGIKSGDSE